MNSSKLKAKDFITVGIFTAILIVVEFLCGMLGYIHPYIVAAYVVMIPLVGAIPMMLFSKHGMTPSFPSRGWRMTPFILPRRAFRWTA